MDYVGKSAHTEHGLGKIIAESKERGSTSYRVAGRGFNVWIPEIKLRLAAFENTIEQGVTNDKNTTTLPYDPSPVHPTNAYPKQQTIVPGEFYVDPEDRLHPSESLSKNRTDSNRPYPGPSPDLFAKSAAEHYAELDADDEGDSFKDWGDDKWHEGLPDGPERPFDKNASYRPAGLSNRYAHIPEHYDTHDPIVAFRLDPVGVIEARNWEDSVGEADRLAAKFAHETNLAEIDPQIRTAAWSDVRTKAMRLRRDGKVHIEDIGPDRIYAKVDGDNNTYETMVTKKGSMGGIGGGQSITNWGCTCDWGKWAFQRRFSFVGRLCSHAYAAYLDMQSQHMKENPQHFSPKKYPAKKRFASIVDDFKNWAKENNDGHMDAGSMTDFINTCDEHVTREEADELYNFLDKNVQEAPERDYDIPYTFNPEEAYKTGEALRQRPLSLTPDLREVPQGEHEWTDVTQDDRETTGPEQIVHFSALASKLHHGDTSTDVMGAESEATANSPAPMPLQNTSITAFLHKEAVPSPGTPGINDHQPHGTPPPPEPPGPPLISDNPTNQTYVNSHGITTRPGTGASPVPQVSTPANQVSATPPVPPPGNPGPPNSPGSPAVPQGATPGSPPPAFTNPNSTGEFARGNGQQGTGQGFGGAGFQGAGGTGGNWLPSRETTQITPGSYTVRPGDTLADIAQRAGLGGNYNDIAKANGITDPNKINSGQSLTIPGTPGGGTGSSSPTSFVPTVKGIDAPSTPAAPGSSPLPQGWAGSGSGPKTLGGTPSTPPVGAPAPLTPAKPPVPPPAPGVPQPLNPGAGSLGTTLGQIPGTGKQGSLSYLLHQAASDEDDERPDTGEAAAKLNELRELDDKANDHLQHMDEFNDDIRDLVEDLNKAGVDAMPFVAGLHTGAPQGQRKDNDPADGDANFAGMSSPNWADEAFNGSGPDPKLWTSDSQSYIDNHERPRHEDVTDLGDDPIIKFNDGRSKPQQGPRHAALPDNHTGYGNPNNPNANDWDQASGREFIDALGNELDGGNGGGGGSPFDSFGGEGGGEGGAAAGEGAEAAEALPLLLANNQGGFSLEAFDRGEFVAPSDEVRRPTQRAGSGPKKQVRIDPGGRGWQKQAQTYSPPEGFGYDGPTAEPTAFEPADPTSADVVAAFHRSGAAEGIMANSNAQSRPGSLDDFASSPMVQSMLRTAGRKFSPEEERALENESHVLGARNMPTEDDLAGTHYLFM